MKCLHFILLLLLLLCSSLSISQTIVNESSTDIDNHNGTHTLTVTSGERFYQDAVDSTWKTINNAWEDSSTYWIVRKNAHILRVSKTFNTDTTFSFVFRNRSITLSPVMMCYNNLIGTGLNNSAWQKKSQSVIGYLKDSVTIRFDSVFGEGTHIEIDSRDGMKIKKIVDSSVLDFPLLATCIDFIFRIRGDTTIAYNDWDYSTEDTTTEVIPIKSFIKNGLTRYFINKPYLKLSGSVLYPRVRLGLVARNGCKYIYKRVYGLKYYSGSLETDLSISCASGCDIYGATASCTGSGLTVDQNGTDLHVAMTNSSIGYIYRAYLWFNVNTSMTTVTATTLTTYCYQYIVASGDLYPIGHSLTSESATYFSNLTMTDYGHATPVNTQNSATTFTFNASGLSYVLTNSGSTVKIALVQVQDYTYYSTCSGYSGAVRYDMYSHTSSSYKPVLAITYTSSSTVVSKAPHISNMHTP